MTNPYKLRLDCKAWDLLAGAPSFEGLAAANRTVGLEVDDPRNMAVAHALILEFDRKTILATGGFND